MNDPCIIRPAVPDDAAALLQIYAPYVTNTAVSFEYTVPSPDEFASRIENTLKKYPYLVAEDPHASTLSGPHILGYAYVSIFHGRAAYNWSVETSIYIDQEKRKCGLGRALHDALETTLKFQGIINMYAAIACPPDKDPDDPYLSLDSIRFHEKLGYRENAHFRKCGYKFDRWYDIIWMEKIIGQHSIPQTPIRPFTSELFKNAVQEF